GVVMVRVPDIRGLYGDAADKKLRAAGLVPKEVSIHGPIEPDAAGIGQAYHVRPAVGTLVPKGSTVSYHSWWESQ
ncbi:MAG: PASTA domain-containing protein, partial [Actinobacteria bacterium]